MVSKLFTLTKTEILIEQEKESLFSNRAGAVSTFEGRVRDHNEGKNVISLEYESYESMAAKVGTKIIEESLARFDILDARAIHRTGNLDIRDAAVWVGVSSVHRKEAFEACQYIIDEIKHRLPVWKKEVYEDGSYEWVNCSSHQSHSHDSKATCSSGQSHSKGGLRK